MFGSRCCLDRFWIHLKENMMFHYDNQNSIKLSNNLMFHMRTKHVEIQHQFMSEKIMFGEINVKHIATQDQIADILMKPLGKIKLAKLKSEMNTMHSRTCNKLLLGTSSFRKLARYATQLDTAQLNATIVNVFMISIHGRAWTSLRQTLNIFYSATFVVIKIFQLEIVR